MPASPDGAAANADIAPAPSAASYTDKSQQAIDDMTATMLSLQIRQPLGAVDDSQDASTSADEVNRWDPSSRQEGLASESETSQQQLASSGSLAVGVAPHTPMARLDG